MAVVDPVRLPVVRNARCHSQLVAYAVLFRSEGVQVGVVGADQKVQLKKVALGRDLGTEIEIVSGLEPADQVAVTRWIEDIRPSLAQRDAFLARVAIHALATVERELAQGEGSRGAATQRLSQWLDRDGDHADLTRELCARLRVGEWGVDTPGLLTLLKANTLEQLAIDQPGYHC